MKIITHMAFDLIVPLLGINSTDILIRAENFIFHLFQGVSIQDGSHEEEAVFEILSSH